MAYSTSSGSHQPPWLEQVLRESKSAPKLYAWTTANLVQHEPEPSNRNPSTAPPHIQDSDLDHRIFILGVGNLGRLFAHALAKSSQQQQHPPPITLVVHRPELLSQWFASDGIEIHRGSSVEKSKEHFDIEMWSDTPPSTGPVREVAGGVKIRNLIVATKASAAMPQVDRVRGYLGAGSTVAFAQNGMSKMWPPHGPAYVSSRWPSETGTPAAEVAAPNFLACITTHGVFSLGPFRSRHASPADVTVGPVLVNERHASAAEYLTQAITSAPQLDGRSVSRADLWIRQVEKLVVNAVINPLTAVLRCKNGVLFNHTTGTYALVIDNLLREASTLLQALVLHPSTKDILASSLDVNDDDSTRKSQLDDTIAKQQADLRDRFAYPRLKDMVYQVGHKVAENTSSMLQDVQAGKPTEVRDFNGWIVGTAEFVDPSIDVSTHRKLVDLVEAGIVLDEKGLRRQLLE